MRGLRGLIGLADLAGVESFTLDLLLAYVSNRFGAVVVKD